MGRDRLAVQWARLMVRSGLARRLHPADLLGQRVRSVLWVRSVLLGRSDRSVLWGQLALWGQWGRSGLWGLWGLSGLSALSARVVRTN